MRTDRKAAIVLLALIAACVSVVVYIGGINGRTAQVAAGDPVPVRAETYGHTERQPGGGPYAVQGRRTELFAFDPNTADSTALLRLGLQPWQVRNIYKYRARGGVYRRPADFARLYGLTVGQYRRLEPYIRISADYQPASTLVAAEEHVRDTMMYPVKLGEGESVVLNTADTSALKRVPGIGSYYARAIVRYGERLGGYVSVGQLDEISGFPPEAKRYFTVQAPCPRRLNLNRMTLSELRRHPYIGFYRAKAIVDYRRQHGALRSLADLELGRDFPPEAVARLEPYIEF